MKNGVHDILRIKFKEAFTEIDQTQPLIYIQCSEGFCVFTKTSGHHVERIFHVTPFIFLLFAGHPNDINDVQRAVKGELTDFLHYASHSDITDQLVLLRIRAILKERFEKRKKPPYCVTGLVLDLRKNDVYLFYPSGSYELCIAPCVILGKIPNEKAFLEKLQTLQSLKSISSLIKKTFKNIPGIPEKILFTYDRKRVQ